MIRYAGTTFLPGKISPFSVLFRADLLVGNDDPTIAVSLTTYGRLLQVRKGVDAVWTGSIAVGTGKSIVAMFALRGAKNVPYAFDDRRDWIVPPDLSSPHVRPVN